LKYLQPFSADGRLEVGEPSDVAPWARNVRNDARALRIGNPDKDNWKRTRLLSHRRQHRRATRHNHVRCGGNQFGSVRAQHIEVARSPSIIDPDVSVGGPPKLPSGGLE